MNRLICNRPGCVSFTAYEGANYCTVHGGNLTAAKQCQLCHGSGREHAALVCGRCGGTGLLDKTSHAPRAGRDRRKGKVDGRGLIALSEK